jgi:transposase
MIQLWLDIVALLGLLGFTDTLSMAHRGLSGHGPSIQFLKNLPQKALGEGSVGTIPLNYETNITLLGVLASAGLQAVMTVEGATDADFFRTYVKQVLGPTLAPGDIVVLDNLSAHKAPGIQQVLARRRARLLYLPPYSPDLSPMELCLSKVKTALGAAKARTRKALDAAVQQAMETVTALDVRNCFRHCGYALESCKDRSSPSGGRLVRTLHIRRWYTNQEERRRILRQLNKGEALDDL